jgi:hypothetical protein
MLVINEVHAWEAHAPEVLQGMLDNLARLRAQGLDVIEDERCGRPIRALDTGQDRT